MRQHRVIVLSADGYAAEAAECPRLADGNLGIAIFDLHEELPVRFADISVGTLRVLWREKGEASVVGWAKIRPKFWAELIPGGSNVLVRSGGWPELWAAGYPRSAKPNFLPMDRSTIATAAASNPTSAAWWLEAASLDNILTDHVSCHQYGGFIEHGFGSDPCFAGDHEWLSSLIELVENEAGVEHVERRALVGSALRESVMELEDWSSSGIASK